MNARMKTRTRVYFGVFDFGDEPDVVSAVMQMAPTEAWTKGQAYDARFPAARRTHSRWALSSGLGEEAPVEAHFDALLTKLETKRHEVGAVAQRFPVSVVVVQYFYEANPQFNIDSAIVRRFAELGFSIYFDQYCLGADEGGLASRGLPLLKLSQLALALSCRFGFLLSMPAVEQRGSFAMHRFVNDGVTSIDRFGLRCTSPLRRRIPLGFVSLL